MPPSIRKTYHIDMGKNKAGGENDDGEGDKEANYEEEEVVAEVVPVVPGRAAAGDDDRVIIVYNMRK